ncbi:hypothetical protein [Maritimibacter sp. UBA3975]|uniref:hypothetical protein n=1 Tax=Maritimibacter sp. UBA3975 TaxID=1946833 RepID=UPI000C0B9354|nr:hypothetical protein [Maritimibacter sp. UBA3975]MAM62676.1 hypothetical protein [Maritimibacter sp.]|tara:strand:- start:1876 stop:2241 length:366 start_codon:yes stop_codon:yes gene_type:complete
MTRVARSPDCANSPKAARAEDIALALMGVGDLDASVLAEGAAWDRFGAGITGRAAITAATLEVPRHEWIEISEVVTHGKAGSVSGRLQRDGEAPRIFCHVIRFTSASAATIAQIVSFDHAG